MLQGVDEFSHCQVADQDCPGNSLANRRVVDGHHLIQKEPGAGKYGLAGTISVEITVPIFARLFLKLSDLASGDSKYPTARLQKGFLLFQDGQELAEEGVGFGVPVLKRGIQTIFPGQCRADHS